MITIRRSDERGHTKIGWLDSRHSFSFGHYHDRWVRVDGKWKVAALRLTHLVMDFG